MYHFPDNAKATDIQGLFFFYFFVGVSITLKFGRYISYLSLRFSTNFQSFAKHWISKLSRRIALFVTNKYILKAQKLKFLNTFAIGYLIIWFQLCYLYYGNVICVQKFSPIFLENGAFNLFYGYYFNNVSICVIRFKFVPYM